MPIVNAYESSEDDLHFLSLEGEQGLPETDQGQSPCLRRSSRKRKSVSDPAMTKGSGTKKKKSSPKSQNSPAGNMPRVARSPLRQHVQDDQNGRPGLPQALESLLIGMEGRLGSKLDATNKKVDRAHKHRLRGPGAQGRGL